MVGTTWESISERLIREAQERGEFDDLPAHGRPIALEDNPYAGDRALAFHLLRNAGAAPPWIETDKEVRRLRDTYERTLARAGQAPPSLWATLRRDLERIVGEHDALVRRLDAEAPSGRCHRAPIGRDAARSRFDAALAADPAGPADPPLG